MVLPGNKEGVLIAKKYIRKRMCLTVHLIKRDDGCQSSDNRRSYTYDKEEICATQENNIIILCLVTRDYGLSNKCKYAFIKKVCMCM